MIMILKSCSLKFLLFIAFLPVISINCASIQNVSSQKTVKGKVYFTGNEPFKSLALQINENKIYILEGSKVKELEKLQGRIVSVKGEIKSTEKPGFDGILIIKSYKQIKE